MLRVGWRRVKRRVVVSKKSEMANHFLNQPLKNGYNTCVTCKYLSKVKIFILERFPTYSLTFCRLKIEVYFFIEQAYSKGRISGGGGWKTIGIRLIIISKSNVNMDVQPRCKYYWCKKMSCCKQQQNNITNLIIINTIRLFCEFNLVLYFKCFNIIQFHIQIMFSFTRKWTINSVTQQKVQIQNLTYFLRNKLH